MPCMRVSSDSVALGLVTAPIRTALMSGEVELGPVRSGDVGPWFGTGMAPRQTRPGWSLGLDVRASSRPTGGSSTCGGQRRRRPEFRIKRRRSVYSTPRTWLNKDLVVPLLPRTPCRMLGYTACRVASVSRLVYAPWQAAVIVATHKSTAD